MGRTRRVIFPALRILIWGVIAVSLVVIAFRPGGGESAPGADPLEPGANFTDALITPVTGDVDNRLSLTGTVTPDDSAQIKAESAGIVHRIWVGDGDEVDTGAPLVVLKQLLGEGEDENLFITDTVRTHSAGTVTIEVEPGAQVEVGDVVAKVSSNTFIVEVEVEPHQMYHLVEAPGTAEVSITNGPEFTCKTFSTRVIQTEEGAATQARCFVPADVLVFPGLSATLEVVTDFAEGVLLLPITAVEGTVGTGKVWQRDAEGELVSLDVELGLTDGEMIEIVSGVGESDEVLEFVPSLEDPYGDGWSDPWEEYPEEEWVDEEAIEE